MVDGDGRKGGLALLRKEDLDVVIQSHSLHHVNSIVKSGGDVSIRFTGFYGFPELSLRSNSWDIIRNIGQRVNED